MGKNPSLDRIKEQLNLVYAALRVINSSISDLEKAPVPLPIFVFDNRKLFASHLKEEPFISHSFPKLKSVRLAFVIQQLFHQDSIKPNLKEYAKAAGQSLSHLRSLCKKEIGMTLNDLNRRFIISKSIPLLQSGDKATVVSERFGFCDPFAFSKSVKKLTGFSPIQIKTKSAGCNLSKMMTSLWETWK